MRTAAAEGRALDERWHLRKGGEPFWAQGLVMPLKDDADEIRGFLKIIRDKTEERRLQDALKERTDELEEADLHKNEFLAMLAHELRNPLAAISNAVTLAARSGTQEDLEWSRDVIARQVKNFAHLIDDLLDVSRITQGKIQLRKEVIDAVPVLRHAVEAVRPLVEERKHELLLSFTSTDLRHRGGPDPAGADARQPPDERREVHARRGPHPAHRRDARGARSSSGCGTTGSASRRSCCRGCSTSSPRGTARSPARRGAWASA